MILAVNTNSWNRTATLSLKYLADESNVRETETDLLPDTTNCSPTIGINTMERCVING